MRLIFLVFLSCSSLFSIKLIGQPHADTDSLFTELRIEQNDSIKIRLYQKIAWINFNSDRELSHSCTDTALMLADRIENNFFIGKCYHYYGLYHRFEGNADSAILNFEKALEVWSPVKDSFRLSGTIFNLGVMSYTSGKYQEAIEYYLDYKRINLKEDQMRGVCEADDAIGNVFKRIKDYDKALEYLLSSLKCAKDINDVKQQSLSFGNLQSLYLTLDSLEVSINYGRQGLALEAQQNSTYWTGMMYDNLAAAYLNLNQLDSALIYSYKAITVTENSRTARHLTQAYVTMGKIQNKLNQPSEAINYLEKALLVIQSGNYAPMERSAVFLLGDAYEKLHNYKKSAEYRDQYITLSDSLFGVEKFEIISNLEIKYETAEKELKLKSQELEISNQTNRKNIFTISTVLLSLLALSIFFFMRNRLSTTKKIAIQREEINFQKINQLEKEKKLLALNAMLEGQEAERMRIAKDLHDGLGGLLSSVKARLTNINSEVKKIESYNIYEKTTSMVDEACDEVRRISHNLLPGALRLDGLKTAVEHLGEELDEAHPFDVKIEIIGLDEAIDETKEVFLYRIIQEATNNIIKYARAKNVLLQLSATEEEYHIIIEDDGIGFNAKPLKENTGLGLKSIQSRVDHLQGELDISSKLGEGTTITIHIPKHLE